MSISEIAKIENTDSEEYLRLVCRIYIQFDRLSQMMKQYNLTESLFYVQLARKCFKEAVKEDIQIHQ